MEKIKDNLINIKDKSENIYDNQYNNSEDYATQRIKDKSEILTNKSINSFDKKGKKSFEEYGFIYFLAENEYAKATRISKIEYLRTFYDYLFRIQHKIFQEPFRIIGKGNKERIGYINEITRKALISYLEIRNKIITNNKNKDYLFLNHCNIRVDTDGIRKAIKRAYEYVGLDDKKYSVHTLRHTCATILYRAGIDIRTIQEILGHVQVDTTEIYTHLYDKEVMNAIAGHPLAKFLMKNAKTYAMAS